MPIQIFSFFSGLGLLDLGFEDAGFNIAFVNEYNDNFLRSYQYIRRDCPHIPEYGYSQNDVKLFLNDNEWKGMFPDYEARENRIIGFLGGPPCPDYSVAGKNEGEKGENGQFTTVYIKLIEKRQPDFFILENVKGLVQTKKHKQYYDKLKRRLYRAGYSLFDSIENSLLYGAPQYRDRLFLIGLRRNTFGPRLKYTFGSHRKYTIEQIKNANWPDTSPFAENSELPITDNIIEELTVEHWFQQNHVDTHDNSIDVFNVRNAERFSTIPEGDSRGKSFKRLHRWRFSPTAAYGNNEVHLHPYHARRISVAEALAIQSAPEYVSIPEDLPLSVKFKMVSNGVPYLMALGVARELSDWLNRYENE